jgi:hypothetical protein
MSIFNTEKTLKEAKVKENLDTWYLININLIKELTEDKGKWPDLLRKILKTQYNALLALFEIKEEK